MTIKLINKNFSLLVFGQSLSLVGDIINGLALNWAVYDVLGSGSKTGLLFGLSVIPPILMYPFAGNLVDFFNRKTLLFICDLMAGILALVLYWLFSAHIINFYYFLLVLSMEAIIFSLLATTKSAIIQNIVSNNELTRANSLNSLINNTLSVITPAIGALLMTRFDVSYCFIINAISFFFSSVFTLYMDVPKIEQSKQKNFFTEFIGGIKYLKEHIHYLYFMLIFSVLNFLLASDNLLIRILMKKMHISIGFFGYYKTIVAVGSIFLAFLLSRFEKLKKIPLFTNTKTAITIAFLFLVVALINYSIGLKSFIIYGAFLQGIGSAWMNITFIAHMQRTIEKEFYGRTISVLFFISEIAAPLGLSFFGALADIIPIQIIFAVISISVFLLTLIFFLFIRPVEEEQISVN